MFYGRLVADMIYSRGQFGGALHRALTASGDTAELRYAYRKAAILNIHRMLWIRGMSLPPPATILDIGCGNGSICVCAAQGLPGEFKSYGSPAEVDSESRWSEQLGFTGVPHEGCCGIDIEEKFIGVNAEVGVKQTVAQIPSDLISVPSDSFDQVIAGEIIEHLHQEQWPAFIGDLVRISRYQVLITTPDWNADDPTGFREPDPKARTEQYGHEAHMYVPNEMEWVSVFSSVASPISQVTEAYRIPGSLVARIIKNPIPGLRVL